MYRSGGPAADPAKFVLLWRSAGGDKYLCAGEMTRWPDQLLLAGMPEGRRTLPRLCSAKLRSEMLLGSSADKLHRSTQPDVRKLLPE